MIPLKTCRIDCKSRSFLNIKTIFKSYSSRCLYLIFNTILYYNITVCAIGINSFSRNHIIGNYILRVLNYFVLQM